MNEQEIDYVFHGLVENLSPRDQAIINSQLAMQNDRNDKVQNYNDTTITYSSPSVLDEHNVKIPKHEKKTTPSTVQKEERHIDNARVSPIYSPKTSFDSNNNHYQDSSSDYNEG